MRDYVIEHLGDPDAVLAGDETGFLKKGVKSAGVQRQCSGTAGSTENCQIGVFLAYASRHGHALIDRELYVRQSWTSDRDRCRDAGIPDEVEFATKPRRMIAMLERAVTARVPFRWFTADEACGQAGYLRDWCEHRDVFSVPTTSCDQQVHTRADRIARADELVGEFADRTWQRLSVGAGAHGPREYDWARRLVSTPNALGSYAPCHAKPSRCGPLPCGLPSLWSSPLPSLLDLLLNCLVVVCLPLDPHYLQRSGR